MSAVLERFWAKVERTETCWLWRGATGSNGYGYFANSGRTFRAHRFAYIALRGPIPEGLTLDHLCRVRNCVNPDHLEPVTNRENLLRGVTIAARNAQKTHCKWGHPFDDANTTVLSTGVRRCDTCYRRRLAEDRERGYKRPSRP